MAVDHPYFAPSFVALAHRGGFSPGVPDEAENTMRAFAAAVDLGFTHLETDVHLTADGKLIAFHDSELDRVTDGVGAVAELPWSEVRQARIAGTEPIPLLSELFEAFPQARFNIDIKAPGAVEPLARTIQAHRAEDRVCVASFSTARLREFRSIVGPRVATSVSPAGIMAAVLARGIRRFVKPVGLAYQVPVIHPRTGLPIVNRRFVEAVHRQGRLVHVWTINNSADMHDLIDLGVDGLISDNLVTLKNVLIERNLWEQ